ncbi:hypothetical protein SAMN05421810_102861 [Amycolatopsis arida]|uniref:Uncharacterized protein n=1 Tax=Amycolatopsis arida TaxID=587909 RepID=A0A1I5R367_9PSEU|nr:hypothetical protein [Amycolatopsis arida]TDX99060.1 hypothetical protein CLV69_101862 [Amycolatopsis arida]SFP52939.1 hypothetical protein SAMN05421810_102861 [Amycolatopsis arida]
MDPAGEQVSPPADFPVYGLDERWRGPRWLDFFEGRPGDPVWAVWLGHREAEGDHGVRVGTLPRERYDEVMSPRGGDTRVPVAFSAAFGLVNLTLPDGSVPRPEGLIPALVEHAERQAKRHREWPRVAWEVDGRWAQAAVWSFADAWAGFTDVLEDAYLVAVGIGVQPEGLRLVPAAGAEYGVDLAAPLDPGELTLMRRARPEAWLPPPRRDGYHPDQLALLARPDRPSPVPR